MYEDILETATMCVDILDDGGQARHINMIVAVDHVLAEKRFPPEGQLWTTPVFAKRFAAVG